MPKHQPDHLGIVDDSPAWANTRHSLIKMYLLNKIIYLQRVSIIFLCPPLNKSNKLLFAWPV